MRQWWAHRRRLARLRWTMTSCQARTPSESKYRTTRAGKKSTPTRLPSQPYPPSSSSKSCQSLAATQGINTLILNYKRIMIMLKQFYLQIDPLWRLKSVRRDVAWNIAQDLRISSKLLRSVKVQP